MDKSLFQKVKVTEEKIMLQPPDEDGPVEITITAYWEKISDASSEQWEGPLAGPREPAEWELLEISLEGGSF